MRNWTWNQWKHPLTLFLTSSSSYQWKLSLHFYFSQRSELFENLEEVEIIFLNSNAKNQVLTLLYCFQANILKTCNREIPKNAISYIKATNRFNGSLIDFEPLKNLFLFSFACFCDILIIGMLSLIILLYIHIQYNSCLAQYSM